MFFNKTEEKFITGNEAAIMGAKNAGAIFMAGYPITPSTEILEGWAKEANQNFALKFTQTEDETSAGFNVLGGTLAGIKSFTATAGVGNVLMQDPISMAEAMRLPFVGLVMQRGGPSTGTVIYSQQEVTLTCYGGNGEGLRIVYSTSNPQEIYDYTIKAFNSAWKYRFPTFVLGDGYQSKMKTKVRINKPKITNSYPLVGRQGQITNIRNCYNFEDQLGEVLSKNILEYEKIKDQITEYSEYKCNDAETIIFAHGIVSNAAKEAIDELRSKHNKKVGLFRPITLRPFPSAAASDFASRARKIIIMESSNGHFSRIVKDNIYGLAKIDYLFKPVMPISKEDIISKIINNNNFDWLEH